MTCLHLIKIMVMKKNILYCLISAAAMFFAGCTFDERLTSSDRIVEGVPTTVNINFGIDGGQVYTRAEENPSVNESRVSNLYVMVFDSDGNRVSTTNNDGVETAFFYEPQGGLIVNPGSPVTGSVSFNVPSMTGATVVAVANISEGGVTTVYTLSKATLDDITTLQGFKDLVVPAMESVIRGNNMLMSAMAENVTISGPEQDATMDCDLVLRRIDAKIKVVLTSSPSNSAWTDFSFQPKTWRVRRVPGQSRLVPFDNPAAKAGPWAEIGTGSTSAWDANGSYFDTREFEFEDLESEDRDNTLYYSGGSFSFYMPENRKVAKKSVSEYALREKRAADGTFEYANDNSTYLEITGYISYKDGGQVINAEVTFYVHLGYAKSDMNPNPDLNDYDTRQNGSYTYNITVTGVNNIVVEVEQGDENRPGYEGDVVVSADVIDVDAHYETRILDIPLSSPFETMTWGVRTPFSSGIYSGSGVPGPGVKDYQWIKFAINRHFNVSHGYYVTFPGDGRYEPGREWTMEEIDAAAANPSKRPLLDIDQLIKYLKAKYEAGDINSLIASGTSEHICITAFVDEYLYTSDPEGNVTSSTPELFWKKCVDTDDRQLHILTPSGDMYSEDGNSSKVTSLHTFTQRSIRTIYNKNAGDDVLRTAWGLETNSGWGSTTTGERLEPGDVSRGSSTRDGRANSLQWMTGSWNTYVDFTTNSLRGNYNSAAYACLMRNRDENGNGTIDNFEVKWYLAAIDQLTDIYIGEWALNEASRLFPQSRVGQYWHYTTSSADGSNPWVLWAEEGASRGSYGHTSDNRGSIDLNGPLYSYRCLRNLGLNDDVEYVTSEIDDIVDVRPDPQHPGYHIIDMTKINPKSLRPAPYSESFLPVHNERNEDGWNLPYVKFSVDSAISPQPEIHPIDGGRTAWGSSEDETDIVWDNVRDWSSFQAGVSPCPDGYRVPNQRELLIMSTRLSSWPDRSAKVIWYEGVAGGRQHSKILTEQPPFYMSATKFSLNGNSSYVTFRDGQRLGFLYRPDGNVFMLLNNNTERGYVRCVKDVN